MKPYVLAVRGIVFNPDGKCLIVRRSATCGNFVGTWEFPGGKVDEGESFDEALRREVREETALVVSLGKVAGAFSIESPARNIAVLCIEATVSSPAVVLSDEHDAHRWADPGELMSCGLTPGLREWAAGYLSRRAGGEAPASRTDTTARSA